MSELNAFLIKMTGSVVIGIAFGLSPLPLLPMVLLSGLCGGLWWRFVSSLEAK